MNAQDATVATVIIGAGIIGTSTAYYLSKKSSNRIYLIESSPELFASASGYAAGFLARDWFSRPLSKLGALSFDLHKQLADEHGGFERWGYCPSTATSLEETVGEGDDDWLGEGLSRVRVAAKEQENRDGEDNSDAPPWLKLKDPSKLDIISRGDTTAQIDPRQLCEFLLRECQSRGVHLHQPARATSLSRSDLDDGMIYNVKVQRLDAKPGKPPEETISCKSLVIAAGAWSPHVFQTLFPESKTKLPISSLAGHSLLLKSSRWPLPAYLSPKTTNTGSSAVEDPRQVSQAPTCHALFTTSLATSTPYSPELFSRFSSPSSISADTTRNSPARQEGYIYIAGLNSPTYPLPSDPTRRTLDPSSISALHSTADHLMGANSYEVVRESVCWRPVATAKRKGGAPVIGCLEKAMGEEGKGVWIAAGHGAWGISLSVGTGYCLAESIGQGGEMEEIRGLGL